MKIKITFLICFCFSIKNIKPQSISPKETVFTVIKRNCASCHSKNNVGGKTINLETIEQINKNKKLIKYVVEQNIMPPWKADTSFHNFINDRRLSILEKTSILQWINDDRKSENSQNTNKNEFDKNGKPDLILKLPKPLLVRGTNKDLFVTYLIPHNLKAICYLSNIIIKPGNNKIVHHARMEVDTSGIYRKIVNSDSFIITDILGEGFGEIKSNPIAIYLPGLNYNKFPEGTGFPIKPKDDIILHIHYAPTPIDEYDQTELWLYFSKTKNPRKVIFKSGVMNDFTKFIPADSISTLIHTSSPLKFDMSVFAVQLHMHLLGKSISLDVITPSNGSFKVLNIPDWDFNWQEYYYFSKPLIIPAGSIFVTTSVFDNTSGNILNPNIPPKTVNFYGMDTKNEMMGFICLGLQYQYGDEKVNYKSMYSKKE